MMKFEILPRHLSPVPARAAHEVAAAELATHGWDGMPGYDSGHIGRTVAVRYHGAVVAGTLTSVTDSLSEGLLILGIGDCQRIPLPYAHPVIVAPDGHGLSVQIRPAPGDDVT